MQIIESCEQGSQEWLQMRCGVVTASMFSQVLSKGTGRTTYMYKLAAERLTGLPIETYRNAAMEWGNEYETMARANYELETGNTVEQVAFVKVNDWVGISPDGLVGNDGLIEIKCPNSTTHLETVTKGKMPTKHKAQVQGQLWGCQREWNDFVSFDPRFDKNQIFITRVYRDEKYIKSLEEAINQFVDELQGLIHKYEAAA